MNEKCKQYNKIYSLGLLKSITILHVDWQWMKNANKYDNKIYSLGLSKTSQFYMLIGNEWKMQTNMITKYIFLLVFQKHHNFTCWLAMNENANNMITKFTLSLSLSKTSQFYMLIGNEWKMQTIW